MLINKEDSALWYSRNLQISLIWPFFFIISLWHGLRPDGERSTDNVGKPGKVTIILFSASFEKTNSGFYFLIEEMPLFPSMLEQEEIYEQPK